MGRVEQKRPDGAPRCPRCTWPLAYVFGWYCVNCTYREGCCGD